MTERATLTYRYFCLLILVTPALLSCNKDEPATEIDFKQRALLAVNSFCPNRSLNHFAGVVLGSEKCFNAGIDTNVGSHVGTAGNGLGAGRHIVGVDVYANNKLSEVLHLGSPNLMLMDLQQVTDAFSLGKKRLSTPGSFQDTGFQIAYSTVSWHTTDSTPVFTTYSSQMGKQDQGYLEVIQVQELPANTVSHRRGLRVSMVVNCALYDQTGQYQGEIRDGLLTGEVWVGEQ
jgi:hypothetical protein